MHPHFLLVIEITVIKDPPAKFTEACSGTADTVITFSIVVVDDRYYDLCGRLVQDFGLLDMGG